MFTPSPRHCLTTASYKMLLKTDYPLRSRDNKVGKSGTVGLCVYLDLEQRKRREKREQAVAARRQQAIDLAIAEVGVELTFLGKSSCAKIKAESLIEEEALNESPGSYCTCCLNKIVQQINLLEKQTCQHGCENQRALCLYAALSLTVCIVKGKPCYNNFQFPHAVCTILRIGRHEKRSLGMYANASRRLRCSRYGADAATAATRSVVVADILRRIHGPTRPLVVQLLYRRIDVGEPGFCRRRKRESKRRLSVGERGRRVFLAREGRREGKRFWRGSWLAVGGYTRYSLPPHLLIRSIR